MLGLVLSPQLIFVMGGFKKASVYSFNQDAVVPHNTSGDSNGKELLHAHALSIVTIHVL